jgi:uncharacterized protein (DUF305 family)
MLRRCLLAVALLLTMPSAFAQSMQGITKLARDIVAAQQKEIAFMKSWQAKHAQ